MRKALLDTEIVSEILKGRNAPVIDRANAYAAIHGRLSTSVLTLTEIARGYQKALRPSALAQALLVLRNFELVELDPEAAILAGKIDGDLERTGQPLGRVDPMIAAIALRHDLTLVTGNTAHYERIEALGYPLRLDNWRNP